MEAQIFTVKHIKRSMRIHLILCSFLATKASAKAIMHNGIADAHKVHMLFTDSRLTRKTIYLMSCKNSILSVKSFG